MQRIHKIPSQQVEALCEGWPEVELPPPSRLQAGQLRPILPWTLKLESYASTASRILFYVDSVILDDRLPGRPLTYLPATTSDQFTVQARRFLEEKIKQLALLRSLVIDEAISFVPWVKPRYALREEFRLLRQLWPENSHCYWDPDDDHYLRVRGWRSFQAALANEVHYAWRGYGNPLSERSEELNLALHSRSHEDPRWNYAATLADLKVPVFSDDVKDLVSLRHSSSKLTQFRGALERTLSILDRSELSLDSSTDAEAIIGDYLHQHLSHLWREAEEHSLPRRLWRQFGLVTATTTSTAVALAFLGQPALGIASRAAIAAAGSVGQAIGSEILSSRSEHVERNGVLAMRNIAMSFR